VSLYVAFCDLLDCTKDLASILGIVDVRDVAAVDREAAFPPRRDSASRRSSPTIATNCWTVAPLPAANALFVFQSSILVFSVRTPPVKGHRSAGN